MAQYMEALKLGKLGTREEPKEGQCDWGIVSDREQDGAGEIKKTCLGGPWRPGQEV